MVVCVLTSFSIHIGNLGIGFDWIESSVTQVLGSAEVPKLSALRRAPVGEMTMAFIFREPDMSAPTLPSTTSALSSTIAECVNDLVGFSSYPLPTTQTMPSQESGMAKKPSGTAC